jgi:hypothetical protein
MATAKTVGEVEREKLEWLMIEDTDGKKYRYEKREGREALAHDTQPHVLGDYVGGERITAKLARDPEGVALLKQEEEGLPEWIVVEYVTPAGGGHGIAWWSGNVAYQRV